MGIAKYFKSDDGSLPEIELSFDAPGLMIVAFQHLYDRGAINVSEAESMVWSIASQSERPYAGPADATLVASGEIEPFHVVLRGVLGSDFPIPDLGIFVSTDSLTLDYRMGPDWGQAEIGSLIELLRQLSTLGGSVSVPWWGTAGEQDFRSALGGA